MTSTTERMESIPPDVVLSAVANDHRRAVLQSLEDSDELAMEFGELVDQVAEHVRADDGGPLEDERRQRVRTALHHIHLPKLEDCEMIVHDTEANQVRYVAGELSQEILTVVEKYEIRD